ncbi:MAG: superoxide dismutase [Deltaproteobacteria bacterium]|nr:superoxide dismutase [Deltaproteobacteria bacterium]
MKKFAFLLAISFFAINAGVTSAARACGLADTIDLPDGFNPEGVTNGPAGSLLVGSIAQGAVYEVSPFTGVGSYLVPPVEGRNAVGMKWDSRSDFLYVAGGPTGKVYVYDAIDGTDIAILDVAADGAMVNDVVITKQAAYFTDSWRPVLYRLALGFDGRFDEDAQLEEIALSGDFDFEPGEINGNGIVSPTCNGSFLIMVNSYFGELYKVNPTTGVADVIDLGDGNVQFGDGMLWVGKRLYVVLNMINQIAEITFDKDYLSGEIGDILTHEDLDVPATIARVGSSLYAVNARFTTPPLPDTTYSLTRVPLF